MALVLNPVPSANPYESGALRIVTSTQFNQHADTAVLDVDLSATNSVQSQRIEATVGNDASHQPRDLDRVD